MAKISYIRTSKDGKLLLLGIVEEGESARYTITKDDYSSIDSPEPHTELGDRELSFIKYADEHYRAEKKAISLLSYADNTQDGLTAKLIRAGFSRQVAHEVAESMVYYGYIDERRQVERLVLIEANYKLRGPKRIISYLVAKGYSFFTVQHVLNKLTENGTVDFEKNAEQLIEKKLPEDYTYEEKKKLLYRNGY